MVAAPDSRRIIVCSDYMCVHLYLLCCFCRGNRAVLLHYGAVNVCAASEVTAQTVTLISLCLAQQVEQGCRRFSAAHLCAAGRTHHLGAAWRRRRAGGCGRGGCSGRAQSFEMCVRDSCTKLLFARCPSAARHSHAYMQHACRGCASAPLAFPLLSARPSLPVLLMFSRPRSRRRTRCRCVLFPLVLSQWIHVCPSLPQIKTEDALPLVRYACSQRVLPVPTNKVNARRCALV